MKIEFNNFISMRGKRNCMRRIYLSRFIGTLSILLLSCLASVNAASNLNKSEEDKLIRVQASDFAKAFAKGNAHLLSNMWTKDGKFIDENGKQWNGRNEIENLYRQFFKQYGGQPIDVSIESIIFPAENIAIEEGVTRLTKFPTGTMSRYTAVHKKENGQWQMLSVTETPCSAPIPVNNLNDLSWLIGNWVAQNEKGKLNIKADWTDNKSFIHCTYQTIMSDGKKNIEEQYIGWNPAVHKIVSWNFDANGGFGRGYWNGDGKSWNIRAMGVGPEGQLSRASYIFSMVNNDKFTWQSKNRSVLNKPLPDTATIEFVREK